MERRQSLAVLENVQGWRETCDQVTGICGQVLYDESVLQGDIGVALDRADRLLFQVRNYTSEARRLLRRREPDLAARLNQASNRVFELRNATTRFLIRCQGPGPLSGDRSDDATRRGYYDRALQEIGFNARQLHGEVEGELTAIGRALSSLIAQIETNRS
jgi:hypothetical protein